LLDPHHTVGDLEDVKGFEILGCRQTLAIHDHVRGMDAHGLISKELALGLIPIQFLAKKGISFDVVYTHAVENENNIPGFVVNGKQGIKPAFYL
jgi:hypothetical protein